MRRRPIIIIHPAIIISIILAVAILCTSLFTKLFITTRIGVRLYQGPRLEITMYVTVDGKNTEVVKLSNDDETFDLKVKNGNTILTAKTSEEGEFIYKLKINDVPVTLQYNHTNWWEIVESNLYITINTETNSYTISENYFFTQTTNMVFCYRQTESEYPVEYFGLDNIVTDIGPGLY